jgi:hypothetical protein
MSLKVKFSIIGFLIISLLISITFEYSFSQSNNTNSSQNLGTNNLSKQLNISNSSNSFTSLLNDSKSNPCNSAMQMAISCANTPPF